jgi:hypothetical protein
MQNNILGRTYEVKKESSHIFMGIHFYLRQTTSSTELLATKLVSYYTVLGSHPKGGSSLNHWPRAVVCILSCATHLPL